MDVAGELCFRNLMLKIGHGIIVDVDSRRLKFLHDEHLAQYTGKREYYKGSVVTFIYDTEYPFLVRCR